MSESNNDIEMRPFARREHRLEVHSAAPRTNRESKEYSPLLGTYQVPDSESDSDSDDEGRSTHMFPGRELEEYSPTRAQEPTLETTSLAFYLSELKVLDSIAHKAWGEKLIKVTVQNLDQRPSDDMALDNLQATNPVAHKKLLALLKAEVRAAKENQNFQQLSSAGLAVTPAVLAGGLVAGLAYNRSVSTVFVGWGIAVGILFCAAALAPFAYEYNRQKSLAPPKTTRERMRNAYNNCGEGLHKQEEIGRKIDAALLAESTHSHSLEEEKTPANIIKNCLASELGTISALSASHARFWDTAIRGKFQQEIIASDQQTLADLMTQTREKLEAAEVATNFAKIAAVAGFSFLITVDIAATTNSVRWSRLLGVNIGVTAVVAALSLVCALIVRGSNESEQDMHNRLNLAIPQNN